MGSLFEETFKLRKAGLGADHLDTSPGCSRRIMPVQHAVAPSALSAF
jgi:hypothetical protein